MEVEENQSNLYIYNHQIYLENQGKFTQKLTDYKNKFKKYRQYCHNELFLQFLDELQQFLLEQQNLLQEQPPLLQQEQQPLQQEQQNLLQEQQPLQRQEQLLPQELLSTFDKILSDKQQFISEQQQFIRVKQNSVNKQINPTYPTCDYLKAILAPNNANNIIESGNNGFGCDRNALLRNLKLKDDYINDLKKANDDLRNKAIKYQLALGHATGSHLENQDSDSADQLSKDIHTLHNRLDKFCGLKRGVEIKESEVKELLERYDCQLIGEIRNNKNLISGLLERHVIETIINKSNKYFKENNEDDEQDNDQRLEAKIVNTTKQLLELINVVPENHTGTDEEHQLIVKLQTEIAKLMNHYCTFKDQKKLSENEEMIEEIVRQVVNIFLFRLKVQEPIAYWKFFENKTCINTIMTEASLDSSGLGNVYVGVCLFSIIGSNLCEAKEENKDLKVIFLVQIIPINLY
ncbi:26453_t:CDS:2 [Dentiscutata erythropus]|uniref:26453_t:CDS:1 n=1 Tax=Dentiscutata erythropus TaxID=1348616 RepID=A0A9N8ZQD0_9GLOM|nr:26453_t:CDS:2 [Dentiscutata erythropus]